MVGKTSFTLVSNRRELHKPQTVIDVCRYDGEDEEDEEFCMRSACKMEFVDANLSRRGMYHKQRRRYDTQPLEGFSQQPWQDFHQTQRKNDDEYWCQRP